LEVAKDLNFADPNVVILKRKPEANSSQQMLYMGLSEDLFEHEGGLITKTEIRAVTLAKLKLLPYHTLWDLGAGSGSVSIEAAVFLERGRIFAVEQKAERIDQIKANIRRFGVNNIETLQAVMPDGLSGLPAPDRVFIGGGGRDLEQIISEAASLMKPDGLMVINTVLIANLETSQKTMRKNGFNTEVVQVQVLRSKAMPWSERFETLNPVWIISGQKT
jgi:precorrin-6Y C5,15-methyltransferase (decarboxylating)